jgi:hypothetical protein
MTLLNLRPSLTMPVAVMDAAMVILDAAIADAVVA